MAERKPFLLRIDPALWAGLEAWAQDELRSVNGQIEYILKQALARRKGAAPRPAGQPAAPPAAAPKAS
ncbi:MAG: Arc family DNA-binding protein [Verrucomicrobiota bacterium]